LSLLWSSFSNSRNNKPFSPGATGSCSDKKIESKTIRHTHSFTCPSYRKQPGSIAACSILNKDEKAALPHGDSGVFPFTSDSSTSSSEANIPTLPAVWLKQQEAQLASSPQVNKSGSLPRSFQVGVQQERLCAVAGGSSLIQLRSRPVTIASDKLQPSDVNCGEVEVIRDNFHEDVNCRNDKIHPASSIDNIMLHPDYKIYRQSNKNSIKEMLLSVTHRLSGLSKTSTKKSNSSLYKLWER
jgi:hypothetical protein